MIYFDSTATTKPRKEILEVFNKVQETMWYNASSAYTLGLKANNLLEKAEQVVKDVLNVPNHNVIFTSGATEANNIAVYGICNGYLTEQKKIITSKIEHPSVYNVFKDLEEKGFEVVYLDVDQKGIIDLKQLKEELNKDTILVSIMWVNNIIGSIEPINEVINLLKTYPRCKLHVDCVQGLGKIKPNFDFNQIDLFTMSAHKLEGIKGSGALIYHQKINLKKHLFGADQQLGLKPGTIDLASAVTVSNTIKYAVTEQVNHYNIVKNLNEYLYESIKDIKGITINSSRMASPYIFNISIRETNAETVMHYLEAKDIYVSIGSACGSKTKKKEKTIYAISNDELTSTTSIRISLSHHNTKDEIDSLINALKAYLEK